MGKSIRVLTLGTGIAQGIMLLGIIVLSRLYSPSEFGVYAVTLGFATIASAASSFRYEMTILLPKYDRASQLALRLSFVITLVTNATGTIVVLLMVATGSLGAFWLAVPITSFFASIINIGSFLQNRKKRYARIVGVQIARSAFFVVSATLASWLEFEGNGLVGAMVLSTALPAIFLLVTDFRRANAFVALSQKRRLIFWARKHRKFVFYSTPAVFVSSLASQAPVFLLSALAGFGVAGYYAMTQRVLFAPVALISGAVNKVYLQSVASRLANGEAIYDFTKSLIRKFLLPGLGLAVLMIVAFQFGVLEKMLGYQWQGIDALSMVMIPAFCISFVAKSIAGFAVLGRNEIGLLYQLILLFSVSAVIAISIFFTQSWFLIFSAISLALSLCFLGQSISILKISKNMDRSVER
jgi:O-antigen/teichoic acid export membrane protein